MTHLERAFFAVVILLGLVLVRWWLAEVGLWAWTCAR